MLGSQTQYDGQIANDLGQPTDEFSGTALTFNYNHNEQNWLVRADYRDFSDDVRADLDFVNRVDFKVVILDASTAGMEKTNIGTTGSP